MGIAKLCRLISDAFNDIADVLKKITDIRTLHKRLWICQIILDMLFVVTFVILLQRG